MTGLDDRKDAHEAKFVHDEKLDFNVEARCCKLFGLRIAEILGFEDEEAKSYAMDVVNANLEEPGFDDVLRKVRGDLTSKGVEISDHVLNVHLTECIEEARKQINAG